MSRLRRIPGRTRHRATLVVLCRVALACLFSVAPADAGASGVSLSGRAEALGVARFDHASPAQLPSLRIDLELTQRLGHGFRWKLGGTGRVGGPVVDPSGAGVFDLGHTFQDIAPSLELGEAWIEYRGESLDIRAGTQRFFWGKLDSFQPGDLLNPRNWQDPLITDEKRSKIAVPAISVDWYFPEVLHSILPEESRASLVWQPIAVPFRYPLEDERWFAPALVAPDQLRIAALPGSPCPCDVRVEQGVRNIDPPARSFDNGNIGLRYSARLAGVDWDLSYYNGYDPQPNFSAAIRVRPDESLPAGGLAAEVAIQPAYERFQSVGGGAAFEWASFTWRTEMAWRFQRPWAMTLTEVQRRVEEDPATLARLVAGDEVVVPAFVERDAFEWGLGADTFFFDDLQAILELHQTVLVNNDVPLLVRNVDTRIAMNLRKPWWDERIETQLVALFGIEAGYQLVRFEADFEVTEMVRFEAGVLGVWGTANSLIGQYRDNDQVFFRGVWTF